MDVPLNAHVEEAMREALFIARELGFPASHIDTVGTGHPQKKRVDDRHLQLARQYRELGDALQNILLRKIR